MSKCDCEYLQTTCVTCGQIICEKILPKSEWICVRDRLPNHEDWVLTYAFPVIQVLIFRRFPEFFQWVERSGRAVEGVTHWISLPEPPKEEL